MSTRTLTACAALGVAVLYAISIPIGSFGDAPAAGASGEAVLRFIDGHRDGVLAASVLNGIAWCALMPAVFAGLRELLRGPARSAATVALICAAVESALIGVALVLGVLLAWEAPDVPTATARMLGDGFTLATSASAWPTVPCSIALALAWRAHGDLPRAVPILAWLVAVLHAIASVGFARSGVLAPDELPALAPLAFALLMAALGVALLRRPSLQASAPAPTVITPA
ncbi:MAG TPA: hypothetical protein VMB05_17150 [Solirubrobacteraceae bacterium]|nr:hypothetical protein [Solirubrobacteraceae bacterium]